MSYDPRRIYTNPGRSMFYFDHPRGRVGASGKCRFKAKNMRTLLRVLDRELGSPLCQPPTPRTVPIVESASRVSPSPNRTGRASAGRRISAV